MKKLAVRSCLVVFTVLFACACPVKAAVIALWDFGTDADYSEEVVINRTAGTPAIIIQGGDKDSNGKSGIDYVDADGTEHAAGRAAAWNNVNSESELVITVDTTGWQDMILRWDYFSEDTVGRLGPATFDFYYRTNPQADWTRLFNNETLIRDSLWHEYVLNVVLFNQLENQPFVQFRMDDLQRGDESGGTFKIDNIELTGALIPGSVGLLAPNGGENLMTGDIFDIRWQTGGTVSLVKLEYSINSGVDWIDIATAPDTGVYGWQIPDANSLDCYVRISNAVNPQVFDVSNARFRIFRCLLQFDLNGDCYVDLADLALLASEWLQCGDVLDPRCL